VLNFAGAFISIEVAATIAKGIVSPTVLVGGDGLTLVLAALIGAMTWNIITWYFSLPSSSSHALIGGVIGAGLGKKLDSVHWSVFGKMASGWVLTIPAAGVMGGVAWAISNAFGKNSSVGALVIVALALAAAFVLWLLAQRSKVTPDELDRTQAGSAGPPPAVAAAGVAA
jgi:PiT family inorganic phosphate transporter